MANLKYRRAQAASQLFEILVTLSQYLANELRAKDASVVVGHIGLLTYLDRGTTNLSDLANYQGVTLPTMSGTINTLVERGWVRREHSDSDRRMVVLAITPTGRSVLQTVRDSMQDSLAEMLSSLAQDELGTLLDALVLLHRTVPRQVAEPST